MKKIFPILIVCFLFAGCNNKASKKMTIPNNTTGSASHHSSIGYAAVNGLKMYYEIHGTGVPLVLIHGGGSTIQTSFGCILPLLSQQHQVIAVEMQAHGHTADIDRPLSFEQDADDIAALLRYLRIDKADIFGFSNGASTTLQFAIRHPGMTGKIIVASTFYKKAGAPGWFWDMIHTASFEGMPQALKDAFLKINPDTSALHRMYERDVARMQSFPDITDKQMQSIKAPALILIGDKDVTTPAQAAEMQQLLPGAQLVVLPGGHGEYMGEITTTPDSSLVSATALLINRFLAQ